MTKIKKVRLAVIIFLLLTVFIAGGLFYARYLVKQNVQVACDKIISLINEDKYQEATQLLLERNLKMTELQKGQLVDTFLQQMRTKKISSPEDIDYDTMQEYETYLALATALEIDGSSPAYNVVKYINGILSLEKELKYIPFSMMINDKDGPFGRSVELVESIGRNIPLYPYSAKIIAEDLVELESLSFSQYGLENYGVSEYASYVSDIVKKTPTVLISDGELGKEEVLSSAQKIIELMEEMLAFVDRMGEVIEDLPDF